jgi:hypothetical protein
MCATEAYPSIHTSCHADERRLSGHVWQLFNGFKEERRRHLQEGSGFFDGGQSPRFREPSVDATHRDLQQQCTYDKTEIPYPVQSDFFYNILVGPLLINFVLDVTGIKVDEIDFGDDDEVLDADPPDNPADVDVGAVLANFQSRTNQVSWLQVACFMECGC